ncbi:DUF397 domain-containing protein [Streptosporangium sp. NPDC049644]|uniref:DUF397 domain-containing protein n=1 Tax=Streptosporangium sp. NPDC049644 TaxID=3155507 RepID=UPI003419E94D
MPEHSHVVWRTSSLSANGADCVQVAVVSDSSGYEPDASRLYLVRDSKNPDGGILTFAPTEWRTFLDELKRGRFDNVI